MTKNPTLLKMQKACMMVHGQGFRMSGNQLLDLLYEHGLPSLAEREKIAAENAKGDDTLEAR